MNQLKLTDLSNDFKNDFNHWEKVFGLINRRNDRHGILKNVDIFNLEKSPHPSVQAERVKITPCS